LSLEVNGNHHGVVIGFRARNVTVYFLSTFDEFGKSLSLKDSISVQKEHLVNRIRGTCAHIVKQSPIVFLLKDSAEFLHEVVKLPLIQRTYIVHDGKDIEPTTTPYPQIEVAVSIIPPIGWFPSKPELLMYATREVFEFRYRQHSLLHLQCFS
jgi:hypothetical protein